MLEALIKTREPGAPGTKRRGDVICVKLAGSPWGDTEQKVHQLVEWDDATLEVWLASQVTKNNPYPVAVNPYANFNREGQMVVRSTEYVDLDALPADLKQRVLDPNQTVEKIAKSVYTRRIRASASIEETR